MPGHHAARKLTFALHQPTFHLSTTPSQAPTLLHDPSSVANQPARAHGRGRGPMHDHEAGASGPCWRTACGSGQRAFMAVARVNSQTKAQLQANTDNID